MTTTREVREAIQRLMDRHGSDLAPAALAGCAKLMNQLKVHDQSELSKVLAMLAPGSCKTPSAAAAGAVVIAESLRTKLLDNAAFCLALEDISGTRGATKAVLADVYKHLYRRSRGVRASMSREELLALIKSERDILLRHGTLEALTLQAVKVAD